MKVRVRNCWGVTFYSTVLQLKTLRNKEREKQPSGSSLRRRPLQITQNGGASIHVTVFAYDEPRGWKTAKERAGKIHGRPEPSNISPLLRKEKAATFSPTVTYPINEKTAEARVFLHTFNAISAPVVFRCFVSEERHCRLDALITRWPTPSCIIFPC